MKNYYKLKSNIINFSIIILFILLGVKISLLKGYGDDLDSHSLILSFISIYENGVYAPSRFQGSPVAEIFYGFIGYNYGSFLGSFLSYIFFITSILIFFKSFIHTKSSNEILLLFIIFCISNPVLFFDNTNPSDYPLSLFLFSAGIYLFKKNRILLTIIFLSLSVGTRIEFILYIFFFLFYNIYKGQNYKKNLKIIFFIFSLSFLIYLPILNKNYFSLDLILFSADSGIKFTELLPRFIFKFYLSLGIFSSFLIFLILYFYRIKLIEIINKNFDIFILLILNLTVFLFMPTKTSILSLSIIFIYIILFKLIKKRIYFFVLIFLNFLFYLISYEVLDIEYKDTGKCGPIVAINANIKFRIDNGYFVKRTNSMKKQIECASHQFGSDSQKYIDGKKIKN